MSLEPLVTIMPREPPPCATCEVPRRGVARAVMSSLSYEIVQLSLPSKRNHTSSRHAVAAPPSVSIIAPAEPQSYTRDTRETDTTTHRVRLSCGAVSDARRDVRQRESEIASAR